MLTAHARRWFISHQIARLNRELESARQSRPSNAGGDTTVSREERAKDRELKQLKKRIEELQAANLSAQRQMQARDREMKRVQGMHSEIEEYKKQKVGAVQPSRHTARRPLPCAASIHGVTCQPSPWITRL